MMTSNFFAISAAILLVGPLVVSSLEETLTFWNLAAVKSWNAYLLPKDQQSEWRLGLGSVSSVINKKSKATLILSQDETSNITLGYFSIVELGGTSSVQLDSNSAVNLSDHSELIGRETSRVNLAAHSLISAQRSSIVPGILNLEQKSKLILSQTKFNTFMSKFVLQDSATIVSNANSHITLIGGSSFSLGPGSSLTISKSTFDIAGDVSIGERNRLIFNGFELTMVGGKFNLDDNVEINTDSKSALTIFGATLNFTEGSKIKLHVQSEFNAERNSSLIMARRDLRLTIEEKAFLIIEQSSHCLMTDDLLVLKQTTMRFKSDSTTSSIRCFSSIAHLVDEKRRRFP